MIGRAITMTEPGLPEYLNQRMNYFLQDLAILFGTNKMVHHRTMV